MIAATTSADAQTIQFQDTYLNLRYLFQDKQPGVSGNVEEVAGNISYANAWTYGSNFVSLDIENFSNRDPANSVTGHFTNNSLEFYGVFRTVLSGNKIFGDDTFHFGPIRDIGLELGGDIDTQDDQFASYKRLLIAGPQFSINLPRGFLNVTVGVSREWNTDAFLPNGNSTSYNATYELEAAWAYPFNVGPVPISPAHGSPPCLPSKRGCWAGCRSEGRSTFAKPYWPAA